MPPLKVYKLKDLCLKIGSGSTPRGGGNSYHMEGISLIRSQNILDLKFSRDGLAFIDETQANELRNVTIEKDDVLLNITGDSVARVCRVPDEILPARVNQHVAIIRANRNSLEPNYLLYFLEGIKPHLLSISEIGATRRAITKGMIEDLEVPLPTLPEQKSIASVLSSLDEKIELLNRNNKTLEQLVEIFFRQWFMENGKRKEGKLGDFVETTLGGEWGKEKLEGDYTLQVQCIRGTDIADLQVGLAERIPVRFIKETKFKSIEPKDGDLIMEISGGTEDQSTGRTIYINQDIRGLFQYPIVFSNFCRLIRPKKKEYMYFLFSYIKFLYEQGDLFNLENGSSGIKNLAYKAFLFELEYKMPAEKAIINFGKTVEPFFKKINRNKYQIKTLQILRDSLLPKLMSVEVRVEN